MDAIVEFMSWFFSEAQWILVILVLTVITLYVIHKKLQKTREPWTGNPSPSQNSGVSMVEHPPPRSLQETLGFTVTEEESREPLGFGEWLTAEEQASFDELQRQLAKLHPVDRYITIKALKNLDPDFKVLKRRNNNRKTLFQHLKSKLYSEYDVEMRQKQRREPEKNGDPIKTAEKEPENWVEAKFQENQRNMQEFMNHYGPPATLTETAMEENGEAETPPGGWEEED